jgi:carboxymethylenebutenolidase
MNLPKEAVKSKLFIAANRDEKKLPGIIVVHENRGLNPYIEDVVGELPWKGSSP